MKKKVLALLLICIFILGVASTSFAAKFRYWGRDVMTGGGTNAMDAIPYSSLISPAYSGHACVVHDITNRIEYVFHFDSTSSDAENLTLPDFIVVPDDQAGAGRWKLVKMISLDTIDTSPALADYIYTIDDLAGTPTPSVATISNLFEALNLLTEEPTYASGDFLFFYDIDASGMRKIDFDDLPAGSGTVTTSGTPVALDFARFTDADTIEGRSYAEVVADLSLEIGTDVQAYDVDLATLATPTAWRVFYSDGSSVITELTLGADGTYLKSTGATTAPVFDTPGAGGDMLKSIYDIDEDGDIDQAAGGLEADISAFTGLIGLEAAGVVTEVDTAAELETAAGLGAFFNEYADDADASTMRTTLGLAIGTDVLAPDGSAASLTALPGGSITINTVTEAAIDFTNFSLTDFTEQTAWRVFYSNTDGDVTELALGADGSYLRSNGPTSAPTFTTPGGSGDITAVLDCDTGDCDELYDAPTAFSDGDATPDISAGSVFMTANTSSTTISNFDTELTNGKIIFVIVNDSDTTFDFTSSGLEGMAYDYEASNGDLLTFVYTTTDNQWHAQFFPDNVTVVGTTEGLRVGDGTPTQTMNGEDAYVEGFLEVGGPIYAMGGIVPAPSTDPYVLLDVTDPDDTDWFIGVNADAGATSDDNLEFRIDPTPGTSVWGWLEPDTGDLVFEGATDNAFNMRFDITDPTANRTVTFDDNDIDLSHTSEDYVLTYNAVTRIWSGEAVSGTGDITKVGDGESGDVLDGSASGGTYIRLYDGNSNYGEIQVPDISSTQTYTMPAAGGTLLKSDDAGSGLTAVDAATGDSATGFFDAGTIEHEYGGLEADVSAYDGLLAISGDNTIEVDTAAELETYANLGAFFNEYADDADAATMLITLGLTATASEINTALDGATTTFTQLNYLNAATGTTGTTSTNVVFSTSPTLVTPILGVAAATSLNTGEGDNELFAMDQDVQEADDVTFNDGTFTGTLSGELGVTLDTAATVDLTSASNARGAVRINNDDDVIDYTLPPCEAGLNVCFDANIYDRVITVDVDDEIDYIILDGVAGTAGHAIDSPGDAGDFICLLGLDSDRWKAMGQAGTWVVGGAD